MITDPWRLFTECQYTDPEIFDPGKSASGVDVNRDYGRRVALTLCSQCIVRDACLDEAMQEERGLCAEWRFMIRGGLTPQQRRELDIQQRQQNQREDIAS